MTSNCLDDLQSLIGEGTLRGRSQETRHSFSLKLRHKWQCCFLNGSVFSPIVSRTLLQRAETFSSLLVHCTHISVIHFEMIHVWWEIEKTKWCLTNTCKKKPLIFYELLWFLKTLYNTEMNKCGLLLEFINLYIKYYNTYLKHNTKKYYTENVMKPLQCTSIFVV